MQLAELPSLARANRRKQSFLPLYYWNSIVFQTFEYRWWRVVGSNPFKACEGCFTWPCETSAVGGTDN